MKLIIGIALALLLTTKLFAAPLPPRVQKIHEALSQNACNITDEPSVYQITATTKLYVVPCTLYAYQRDGYVYLTKHNDQTVTPVTFLSYNPAFKGLGSQIVIGDPMYDVATRTIYGSSKGRGLGDCGQSSVSKIILNEYGASVKTIEIRHKDECNGKIEEWPVVFAQ